MRATVSGVACRPASVRATSFGAMKKSAKTATVMSQRTRMPRAIRRTRKRDTGGLLSGDRRAGRLGRVAGRLGRLAGRLGRLAGRWGGRLDRRLGGQPVAAGVERVPHTVAEEVEREGGDEQGCAGE